MAEVGNFFSNAEWQAFQGVNRFFYDIGASRVKYSISLHHRDIRWLITLT